MRRRVVLSVSGAMAADGGRWMASLPRRVAADEGTAADDRARHPLTWRGRAAPRRPAAEETFTARSPEIRHRLRRTGDEESGATARRGWAQIVPPARTRPGAGRDRGRVGAGHATRRAGDGQRRDWCPPARTRPFQTALRHPNWHHLFMDRKAPLVRSKYGPGCKHAHCLIVRVNIARGVSNRGSAGLSSSTCYNRIDARSVENEGWSVVLLMSVSWTMNRVFIQVLFRARLIIQYVC